MALVASACGDSANTNLPTQAEPAAHETPAGVGIEQFSSEGGFSPDGDILDKVRSGTWTIEEGIITHLKLHVGEIRSKAYSEIDEQFEVSDLIALAYSYLRTGKDEDAKREIERLLNIADPDIEDILQNAQPVDLPSTTSRLDGVPSKILDVLIPATHAQSSGCQPLWDGTGRPVGVPASVCNSVHTWEYLGRTHHIIFPSPWATAGDRRIELVSAAKEAINRSLSTYNRNLVIDIHGVILTILTGDNPSNSDVYASAWPAGGQFESSSDCKIKMFRTSYDPFDDDTFMRSGSSINQNFRQVVAHEVFHCVQYWNLISQMFGPFATDAQDFAEFTRPRKWWSEGTAEYFSNTAYDCNQLEWGRIPDFDRDSQNLSIVDMTYQNTVLFQALANKVSDEGVMDVLRAMPVTGRRTRQLYQIGGTSLASRFHEIAEEYVDGNVADSCPGVKLPLAPGLEEVLVERGNDYYFDSDPYQLNRRKLAFDATSLKIEYSSSGVEVDDSYREEATSWLPPPTEVEGACSAKEGKLVFTLVNTTDVVEYIITELSDPEPSSAIDSCLVGSWTATDSSLREIANWVASNPLTNQNVTTASESTTGRLRAIVERTGRASGRMTDLEQTFESSIRMGDQTISNRTTVIINGSSMAKYSADGNKLTVWNVCTDSTARARVEMNGNVVSDMDIDLQNIADMGSVAGFRQNKETGGGLVTRTEIPAMWEFGYRCAGGNLEIDPPTKDLRPPWRFTRD